MSIQHANRGIVKKNLQLYYNREFSKSFPGEATSDISKPISISPQGGSLTVATTYPAFSEDMTVGNYFKNAPNGGVLYHLVTNPALSNNAIYNNNGGIASTTVVPISGTYLIFSFYVYLTQLYTGYNGALGGYINVNTNGGGNGSVGSVLTSYGWSFYVNGVLDNAWSNNSAYLNKWVRVVAVVNNGAISASAKYFSSWYIYNDRLTGGSMYIAKFQIEQKSYVTRPVIYDVLTNTSNRGETTTNLISNPDFTSTSNWNGVGNVTLSNSTVGTKTYLNVVSNQNGSTPGILSDAISVTAGTVYTLSAYASRASASPETYLYVYNVTAGTDIIWTSQNAAALGTNEGWCVNKFTVPAGCTSIKVGILFNVPSIGNTFSVEKMQLEQREYQSAFVVGSRTANIVAGGGGLLDISGNNINADLTNVSFDSTGFYLAGTASANRIQFTTPTSFIYSAAGKTVLMWIRYTSSSYTGFCGLGNAANGQSFNLRSANTRLGFMGYNADYDPGVGPILNNDVWHLIGATFDAYGAGTLKLYVDGVNIASTALTLNTAPEASNIGYIGRSSHGGGNEGYFGGQVGQFMMYNRPLSADEILQIFNSQRKTYGV